MKFQSTYQSYIQITCDLANVSKVVKQLRSFFVISLCRGRLVLQQRDLIILASLANISSNGAVKYFLGTNTGQQPFMRFDLFRSLVRVSNGRFVQHITYYDRLTKLYLSHSHTDSGFQPISFGRDNKPGFLVPNRRVTHSTLTHLDPDSALLDFSTQVGLAKHID